jgi:glutamate transport system permease protein
MGVVLDHRGEILNGLLLTIELTIASYLGALLSGTVVAVCRISPILPLRALGVAYVTVIRNLPLLVLLVLFVFGLPEIGVLYGLVPTVITAMSLYGGAYVAEVVRSGILTVGVGQGEAARAIGLTFTQSLRYVILPQAFRSMIQPLGNIFIGVALNTALAAAVAVKELTGWTHLLTEKYAEALPLFLVSAAAYLTISLSAGLLAGALERRVAIKR